MGIMDYWRSREKDWPYLTAMAFDFLAAPAISSKYKRVFSFYIKMTIPKSSRLTDILL
jgi:hypothetical protein